MFPAKIYQIHKESSSRLKDIFSSEVEEHWIDGAPDYQQLRETGYDDNIAKMRLEIINQAKNLLIFLKLEALDIRKDAPRINTGNEFSSQNTSLILYF